eukprot:5932075-Pleurochrysis_carterae.AAC.1
MEDHQPTFNAGVHTESGPCTSFYEHIDSFRADFQDDFAVVCLLAVLKSAIHLQARRLGIQ